MPNVLGLVKIEITSTLNIGAMKNLKENLIIIQELFKEEESEKFRQRKIRLAEMILRLRFRRKKKFGLFIIVGWRSKWNKKYVGIPDSSQDIFSHRQTNIFQFTRSFKRISKTVNFDGAILVDKRGAVKRSGVILEGLRPRRLAQEFYPESSDRDLSVRFGFKQKVHLRHLSAIAASYELRGTTVYTVSEETGDMHIFERGKIIFSTVKKEMNHAN